MPFRIIRNDITKVHADAIVNTANPQPTSGSGTDAAIYHAAGEQRLLAARRGIGALVPGQAAVTPAFDLPATYIIHTVGPAWVGGRNGELDTLRACYRNSLVLADQLGCKSIAFPLISTGAYGFPKSAALEVALSAIRDHLEHSDLEVTLVVFGRDSYQLASGLVDQVDQYIDENYYEQQLATEIGESRDAASGARPFSPGQRRRGARLKEEPSDGGAKLEECAPAPLAAPSFSVATAPSSLEDAISSMGQSFQATLFALIDQSGMTDAEVYKRANLDRKLFSKIRCNEAYIPKKQTILALAIALRLSMAQARELLASAGFTLTNNNLRDVIVSYCIESRIYDIFEVNALLFKYDQPLLS